MTIGALPDRSNWTISLICAFKITTSIESEMVLLTTSTSCNSTARTGAGGYVHIVCGRLKTWQMDVKMNCSCSAVSFLDEDTVTTSGVGTAFTHNYLP